MTQDEYRIAAFGAIRRAAERARTVDRITEPAIKQAGFTPYGDEIRRAIRAAIGSEKT